MDRGRVLAAMDQELLNILQPCTAVKMNYITSPATTMQTVIFWSLATFGPAAIKEGKITRTATVSVFAYQEGGE